MFQTENEVIRVYDQNADVELISSTLIKNDIMLHRLLTNSMSLEEFFVLKTQQNGGA